MNSVLLIFDDPKEIQFFETNLAENKFEISQSKNLKDALILAQTTSPNLIVINIQVTQNEIIDFSTKVKTKQLNDIAILSLVESENYFNSPIIDHLITKPVRPKLLLSIIRGLMNKEDINWLPAIH